MSRRQSPRTQEITVPTATKGRRKRTKHPKQTVPRVDPKIAIEHERVANEALVREALALDIVQRLEQAAPIAYKVVTSALGYYPYADMHRGSDRFKVSTRWAIDQLSKNEQSHRHALQEGVSTARQALEAAMHIRAEQSSPTS